METIRFDKNGDPSMNQDERGQSATVTDVIVTMKECITAFDNGITAHREGCKRENCTTENIIKTFTSLANAAILLAENLEGDNYIAAINVLTSYVQAFAAELSMTCMMYLTVLDTLTAIAKGEGGDAAF
jgi:hypothetical protein